MTRNNGYKHPFSGNAKPQPFDSAEEVWFWFIMAQQARNEGARFSAGAGMIPRPCEPLDILKILDSLYRQRRLQRDHLLVLRHYGRRNMPPDPRRVREVRAFHLWAEALERMEPVLFQKRIITHEKGWLGRHIAAQGNLGLGQYELSYDEERMAAE